MKNQMLKILWSSVFTTGLCWYGNVYADNTVDNAALNQLQAQIVQLQKQTTDQLQALQQQISKNAQSQVDQLQKQIQQIQQESQTNITAVQGQIKQTQQTLQAEIEQLHKDLQALANKVH